LQTLLALTLLVSACSVPASPLAFCWLFLSFLSFRLCRHQQRLLQNTRRKLELEDRADNVERNARLMEYRRLKLLEKIEAEDRKTQELAKAREELLEQRRRTAKQVLQQKHELADAMLELQITKKMPEPGGSGKQEKKRKKTRRVSRNELTGEGQGQGQGPGAGGRRSSKGPQTRTSGVDDADFDFEELFSSNFYAT
jgi:hypothetical protein